MTLGSSFSPSEPQFPYLCDGDLSLCLETLLWMGRSSRHLRINHYPGILSKAIKAPSPLPQTFQLPGVSEQG